MEKIAQETYDRYIKALTEISAAITSDKYLEDILKLIVMVTARVTGVEICSLWLIEERDKYRANSVYPGVTGLAQVNGRDELPIKVKAEYDGEYVEEIGAGMDIKIILQTIGNVFSAKGVKEGTK